MRASHFRRVRGAGEAEPDPQVPRYIITGQGVGYRFVTRRVRVWMSHRTGRSASCALEANEFERVG